MPIAAVVMVVGLLAAIGVVTMALFSILASAADPADLTEMLQWTPLQAEGPAVQPPQAYIDAERVSRRRSSVPLSRFRSPRRIDGSRCSS